MHLPRKPFFGWNLWWTYWNLSFELFLWARNENNLRFPPNQISRSLVARSSTINFWEARSGNVTAFICDVSADASWTFLKDLGYIYLFLVFAWVFFSFFRCLFNHFKSSAVSCLFIGAGFFDVISRFQSASSCSKKNRTVSVCSEIRGDQNIPGSCHWFILDKSLLYVL